MGVSDLYRRFNMAIKIETIRTNPDLTLYELRSPDVNLIFALYDKCKREMKQSDVLGSPDWEYKILNYRSFLLNNPRDSVVFAVYKGSSEKLTSMDQVIDLPDSMFDALLKYVAYMGHSTINKDNVNEASQYFNRYEAACIQLENQGYKIPLDTERIAVALKGYV